MPRLHRKFSLILKRLPQEHNTNFYVNIDPDLITIVKELSCWVWWFICLSYIWRRKGEGNFLTFHRHAYDVILRNAAYGLKCSQNNKHEFILGKFSRLSIHILKHTPYSTKNISGMKYLSTYTFCSKKCHTLVMMLCI